MNENEQQKPQQQQQQQQQQVQNESEKEQTQKQAPQEVSLEDKTDENYLDFLKESLDQPFNEEDDPEEKEYEQEEQNFSNLVSPERIFHRKENKIEAFYKIVELEEKREYMRTMDDDELLELLKHYKFINWTEMKVEIPLDQALDFQLMKLKEQLNADLHQNIDLNQPIDIPENLEPHTLKTTNEEEVPTRGKLTSSEWLLLEVAREKLQTAQRELARHKTELQYFKHQLEQTNTVLASVTREYSRDFAELKKTLIREVEIGSFKDRENAKELLILSTFGTGLVSDLTEMLDDERKNSAEIILRMRSKYENEKRKMEKNHASEIRSWKRKLLNVVELKAKLEPDLFQEIVTMMEETNVKVEEEVQEPDPEPEPEPIPEPPKAVVEEDVVVDVQENDRKKKVSFAYMELLTEEDQEIINSFIHKDLSIEDQVLLLKKQLASSFAQNRELKKQIKSKNEQVTETDMQMKRMKKGYTKMDYENTYLKETLNDAKNMIQTLTEENRSLSLRLRRVEHVPQNVADDAKKTLQSIKDALKATQRPRSVSSAQKRAKTPESKPALSSAEELKLKKQARLQQIEEDLSELKVKVSGWKDIVNGIDVGTIDNLHCAVKEAELFEAEYNRKLEKWEKFIDMKSPDLLKIENRNLMLANSVNKHESSPLRSTPVSQGNKKGALNRATEKLAQLMKNKSDDMNENSGDEESDATSPDGGDDLKDLNVTKVTQRADFINLMMKELAENDRLSEREKKSLRRMLIEKKNLDKERGKRWEKVAQIAQDFTRLSKLHPRLKNPVPLAISTVNTYADVIKNLEEQANYFLKPKFGSKTKREKASEESPTDDNIDVSDLQGRKNRNLPPIPFRSISAFEQRSKKYAHVPSRIDNRSPMSMRPVVSSLNEKVALGSLRDKYLSQQDSIGKGVKRKLFTDSIDSVL